MNFSQADAACQAEDATLATFQQLGDAQQVNKPEPKASDFLLGPGVSPEFMEESDLRKEANFIQLIIRTIDY